MTNSNGGFMALISVIIISALLLTIVVALNLIGFLGRYNILDSEFKERSSVLAEACVDITLMNLANDPSYIGGGTPVPVPPDTCDILIVQADIPTGQTTIKTKAVFQKATTNLEIVVNSSDLTVVSWKECRLNTGTCN